MYIVLILIITSFLMAFIPIIGIIPTAISSIISIVLSVITMKKDLEKNKKDLKIICIIISTISIIVCVIVNVYSINKFSKYFEKLNQDEKMGYVNNILMYDTYNLNDEILKDDYKLLVDSLDKDGNEYVANINIQSLTDTYDFSVYDFFIYDIDNNKIYYPRYSSKYQSLYLKRLMKNEINNVQIKFNIEENIDNMYLIYRNGDNCVKIKI